MLTHPNACHRIFNIRKHYINDLITWVYTKYYCFFKHEYGVINNVTAKKTGAYFLWATLYFYDITLCVTWEVYDWSHKCKRACCHHRNWFPIRRLIADYLKIEKNHVFLLTHKNWKLVKNAALFLRENFRMSSDQPA